MVVLEAGALNSSLLGGPYGQGAPALKLVQKRYLGIHQWLSPIATKDLKEQIVSVFPISGYYFFVGDSFAATEAGWKATTANNKELTNE